MKKLAALIISLFLLCSVACAEIDLSEYSYDDLTSLYFQVQRELMSRPEWKSVTVPMGSWVIGVDIPAGAYTLEMEDPDDCINVFLWGAESQDFDTNGGILVNEILDEYNLVFGKIILKEGNVLEINGTVIMTPVKGLGF